MVELVERNCTICGDDQSALLLEDGPCGYRECRTCAAIYTSPYPADYGRVNELAFEVALDRYAAKITERLPQNKKKLVGFDKYRKLNTFLEIGCNAGATLVAAEALGWRATGVDISFIATQYAREEQNLNALTGTLTQADLPANSFDLVYSNAVMEHIENPLETMNEAHRILRPGGIFFADTVNWESNTRYFLGEHWRYLEPMHHVQLYTPTNVRELAKRSNFVVERIWTTGVRLEDTKRGKHYQAPLLLRLCKSLFSIAVRFNKKGDSIKFLLRKE